MCPGLGFQATTWNSRTRLTLKTFSPQANWRLRWMAPLMNGHLTMRNRKKQPTKTYKVASTELVTPRLSTDWLEEPGLLFANGNVHPDPKTGIPLYGPWSLATARHKREVHVGFIGTSESVD